MENNESGSANTAVGYQALHEQTTNANNTAVGWRANYEGGSDNTAVGMKALQGTSGFSTHSTAVGEEALEVNDADGNTAVGYDALQ